MRLSRHDLSGPFAGFFTKVMNIDVPHDVFALVGDVEMMPCEPLATSIQC